MRQILRKAGGPEHELNEGQTNIVHGAGAERARRRPQSAASPAPVGQFPQQVGYLRRQANERAGGGTVGEMIVLPKIPEHFNEVRFAAAEKTADPDGLLLLTPQAIEVGLENSFKAARIFAIAHEGLQLKPERFGLALVIRDFRDLGDAVVEQLDGRGITEVEFAVLHGLRKVSVEVMGTAM